MKGDKESLMRLPLAHLQVFACALGVTYTRFELKESIVDNIQKQIRDAKTKSIVLINGWQARPVDSDKLTTMTGNDVTGVFNIYGEDCILIKHERMITIPISSIVLTEYE